MDNTTELFFIKNQGGTHSLPLLYLAVQLWKWCLECHIFPIAVHITSHDNQVADFLSRNQTQMHEWLLDQFVFLDFCKLWRHPHIDIFATSENSKCPLYCSRAGIGSLGDALMFQWTEHLIYLSPPILLLLRAIVKLCHNHSNVILIAP